MVLEQETTNDGNYRTIVVDLSTQEGSPLNLTGLAWTIGKQIGFNLCEIKQVVNEMINNGYDNLINVFECNFGDLVILINKKTKINYEF